MRRRLRRTPPTCNERFGAEDRDGSVTLEAALVAPLFLMLAFTMVYLIHAALLSMALHGLLSQTVRQTAAAWYPISAGIEQAKGHPLYGEAEQWANKLAGWTDILAEYGEILPGPLQDWAKLAQQASDSIPEHTARAAMENWIRSLADKSVLLPSRIHVTRVELPSGGMDGSAFVSVTAEYRLPLRFPFTDKPLAIREWAKERVWIGGTPSTARLDNGSAAAEELRFLSLEPDPVRPGLPATLRLKARSGQSADLSVYYKSGRSEAKHLGSATADPNGILVWTWHVSGRTTPGEWYWEATSSSGSRLRHSFRVETRPKG